MKKVIFTLALGAFLLPSVSSAIYDPENINPPVGDGPMLMTTKAIPTLFSAQSFVVYKDPQTKEEYNITDDQTAFTAMKKYALGISQASFDRFSQETPEKLNGQILLNVEDKGKAYIVDYQNNQLIYLGKPSEALVVFRDYLSINISNPNNAVYTIDSEEFSLENGEASREIASDSASKDVVKVFEAFTTGDMNGDNIPDTAVILTRNSGGSGVFYYIAVAIKEGDHYQGSNAILLGDRIAPQTTEINNNELIVNYAVRGEGDSFAVQPSIGVSKYLVYKDGVLAGR